MTSQLFMRECVYLRLRKSHDNKQYLKQMSAATCETTFMETFQGPSPFNAWYLCDPNNFKPSPEHMVFA